MNFCNVRNSSGGSTEQMENQLPLMPSPVILLQIFIVEGFFHVCLVKLLWLGKREGEGERLHFRYLQVCQRAVSQVYQEVKSCRLPRHNCHNQNLWKWDHGDKEPPQPENGIYHRTIKKEGKVLICWNGARRRGRRGEHVKEPQRTFMEWGSKKRRMWGKMQVKHMPLTVYFRSTYTRNLQVTYY